MTRADHLKRLIQSHNCRDDSAFRDAASKIIEEEREKHHAIVAYELEQILNGDIRDVPQRTDMLLFDPPPVDIDSKTPLFQIRRPEKYLSDLVLGEALQRFLGRLLREFADWEILQANGLQPVQRVLFCGPPGCGKTAAAEAIAGEIGLPLLYVRFDAIVSSLLGETASNLQKVFDYARKGQWVIFFDEFDAIARSRDDVTEHGEIKRVVNSFLQILDNFRGRSLVIAATNFEQSLDPAIWRRFDEILHFDKPTADQLRSLVRIRLRPLRYEADQAEEIVGAVSGSTFADAERVCLDIRKHAALNGDVAVTEEAMRDSVSRYIYRRSILEYIPSTREPMIDRP